MTKDVLISISGLQFAGGENSEPVEVITSGSYYKKNGRHYIVSVSHGGFCKILRISWLYEVVSVIERAGQSYL